MFPQKLKDLLEGVGYKCLQGDDQVLVNDVVYDSRSKAGLCVRVPDRICGGQPPVRRSSGGSGSGGCGSQQAAGAGKRNAGAGGGHPQGDGYMSAALFGHPAAKLKTVGITGTKGKTTTACMIKTILEKGGNQELE